MMFQKSVFFELYQKYSEYFEFCEYLKLIISTT